MCLPRPRSKHNLTCMHFIRSLPGKPLDCSLGYGEQSNMITHYLDGSNVYGSGNEEAARLRAGSGGRLRVTARGRAGRRTPAVRLAGPPPPRTPN